MDRDSLQSSLCRQFDLKSDYRKVPPAEQGIASMMVDLYKTFDSSLTHEYLYHWHKLLFNGQQITKIGAYRDRNEPMRIVSGPINYPKVHFEAPPAHVLYKEIEAFIRWYNNWEFYRLVDKVTYPISFTGHWSGQCQRSSPCSCPNPGGRYPGG